MVLFICLENHILVRGKSGNFMLRILNEPCLFCYVQAMEAKADGSFFLGDLFSVIFLLLPGESSPNCPCVALGQETNLIYSNLLSPFLYAEQRVMTEYKW